MSFFVFEEERVPCIYGEIQDGVAKYEAAFYGTKKFFRKNLQLSRGGYFCESEVL